MLPLSAAQPLQPIGDGAVGIRIEDLEREVLELLADGLHAHAAGQRGVDVDRLLGNALALVGRDVLERAHVVQAVGELDQQHADVLRHRQQQLAQILGLGGFLGNEVEAADLGQPVDQRADLGAEQVLDLAMGGIGILDHVMQEAQRRWWRRRASAR